VCVCAREQVERKIVCVCARAREKERQRQRETERKKEKEKRRGGEKMKSGREGCYKRERSACKTDVLHTHLWVSQTDL